jgi:hypothetical protein
VDYADHVQPLAQFVYLAQLEEYAQSAKQVILETPVLLVQLAIT